MKFSLFSVMDHYPTELARTEQQFVQEFIDQVVLGDQLAYECAWLAEHHFAPYGLVPNPAVVLAAAAVRTSRIKLGPAIIALPLRNPVNAAEDYALVDLISGGRVNLGVGSGYLQHEFAPIGVPLAEKAERFNEALDLFRAYLSQPTTTFEGKFHRLAGAANATVPIQRPHPPIWVAILRTEAAYHVGRKGMNMMGIAYVTVSNPSHLKAVIDSFKQGYAESGAPADLMEIAIGLKVYVAETRAQAIADAREFVERYLRSRQYAKGGTFDSLLENGLIAVGDPDDVTAVFKGYEAAGVTQLMALQNFGGMPHEKVCRSMELLARHVMPRFQPRGVDVQV